MIAAGLVLASFGGLYQLYASNLLLIGLLGASGMFSPMMAYVTRWFDRHRGSAIALVSSGQYVAGAVWPLLFQLGVDAFGWRLTMRAFAIVVAVTILPLAAWFFRPPPAPGVERGAAVGRGIYAPLRQLHPNLAGVIYDRFGFYAPAFAVGLLFNLLNLAVVGILVRRSEQTKRPLGTPRQTYQEH
jgi:MFS family permease